MVSLQHRASNPSLTSLPQSGLASVCGAASRFCPDSLPIVSLLRSGMIFPKSKSRSRQTPLLYYCVGGTTIRMYSGSTTGSSRRQRRLSTILLRAARNASRRPLTIADLQSVLGERAAPAIMLILSALNMVPAPPGTSAILGPPLVFFAVQLILGSPQAWLPAWLLERNIPSPLLQAYERRVSKRLKKAEALLRPRLTFLTGQAATKPVGVLSLFLAIVLAMPIPFGNFLPGLAISLLALGLIGRDGVFILAGVIVALVGLTVVAGPVYALALWVA